VLRIQYYTFPAVSQEIKKEGKRERGKEGKKEGRKEVEGRQARAEGA
jgi:predicted transposase YdaD